MLRALRLARAVQANRLDERHIPAAANIVRVGGWRLTCPSPGPRVPATMTDRDLERFLLRIALPPVRLGLYVKRLKARRADPVARRVAVDELRRVARIRKRLAPAGWWN